METNHVPLSIALAVALICLSGCPEDPAGDDDVSDDDDTTADDDSTGDDDTEIPGEPVRLELGQRSLMLTAGIPEDTLVAVAFDADDEPVDVEVAWTSSDPTVVQVSPDGVVSAQADRGSAWVTAEGEGLTSEPAMVYVATPVAGAVLFDDDQVVGEPELVDDADSSIVGLVHAVTLSGIDLPAVGAVVLGRGDTDAGGRVLAASETQDGVALELEVLSLIDLFEDLRVSWEGDLEPDTLAFDTEDRLEFELGPFECEASAPIDLDPSSVVGQVDHEFGGRFHVDIQGAALQEAEVVVEGALTATFLASWELPPSWEGTVTCGVELASIPIPVGGPIGKFAGPSIPVGVGFELAGALGGTAAELGVDAELTASLALGFTYDPENGLQGIDSFDHDLQIEPILDLPDPQEDIYLEASAFAYFSAGLDVGVKVAKVVEFSLSLLQVRAGPRASLELAFPIRQVDLTDYASGYGVSLAWDIGAGSDIQKLLKRLGLDDDLDLTYEDELTFAHSPTGELTFDAPTVEIGESVTATVDLQSTSFLYAGYNVDQVILYRVVDDEQGGFSLQEMAALPASDGQTSFPWDWTPTEDDEGIQTFVAFVITELAPGVELEIEEDSRQEIEVAPWMVRLQVTGVVAPQDDPADAVDGDQVLLDQMDVIQGNYLYAQAMADSWMAQYDYYLAIQDYTNATNALQLAGEFQTWADVMADEYVFWAEFYSGIVAVELAPTLFNGGETDDDYDGDLSWLEGWYEAATIADPAGFTWDTLPAESATHAFLTGPSFNGNPMFFLMANTKAADIAGADQGLFLFQDFWWMAAYMDDEELQIEIDGQDWIESNNGSLTGVSTSDVWDYGQTHQMAVRMTCTGLQGGNPPTWGSETTLSMTLFTLDFAVDRVLVQAGP